MTSDPLDQIRRRFLERCGGDLHRLKELRSTGAWDNPAGISAMTGIAHSLAGAGGTLGFPEISSRAFEVESILLEENFDGRAAAALDQLIQTLEAVTASSK